MRLKAVLFSSVVALAAVGVTAVPADALTRNCSSTSARMCIHYNSVGLGYQAEFGSDYNVPSFNPSVTSNDIYFVAGSKGSAGAGQWVWNNAASLRNLSTTVRVGVFQNSNYTGASDIFPVYTKGNLVDTKNDNASMGWGY